MPTACKGYVSAVKPDGCLLSVIAFMLHQQVKLGQASVQEAENPLKSGNGFVISSPTHNCCDYYYIMYYMYVCMYANEKVDSQRFHKNKPCACCSKRAPYTYLIVGPIILAGASESPYLCAAHRTRNHEILQGVTQPFCKCNKM